jgi:hypothetical protein
MNALAIPVDSTIEVAPPSPHGNSRLIDSPGRTDWARESRPTSFVLRNVAQYPAHDSRMRDDDAALGHHSEIQGLQLRGRAPGSLDIFSSTPPTMMPTRVATSSARKYRGSPVGHRDHKLASEDMSPEVLDVAKNATGSRWSRRSGIDYILRETPADLSLSPGKPTRFIWSPCSYCSSSSRRYDGATTTTQQSPAATEPESSAAVHDSRWRPA